MISGVWKCGQYVQDQTTKFSTGNQMSIIPARHQHQVEWNRTYIGEIIMAGTDLTLQEVEGCWDKPCHAMVCPADHCW